MAKRNLIVIGASIGGVPALSRLAARLPPDLPAAVLVVLHVGSKASVMPELLASKGPLPAAHATDGQPLRNGCIFVAPPDRHLVVVDGVLRVRRGAWENGYRPSIDVLFRSAARWYGPRVVGVVLSGALDDGAAGLASVSEAGGLAIDGKQRVLDVQPTSLHERIPLIIGGEREVAEFQRLAAETV